MKKENIYIDLSKCTGEQIENIHRILGDKLKPISPSIVFNFPIMHYHEGMWVRTNLFQDKSNECSFLEDKTELTYPEFIKLFEGKERVKTELIPDAAYWRYRCLLAEKCLSVSPCDPDITEEQINSHKDYNEYLKTFGKKD